MWKKLSPAKLLAVLRETENKSYPIHTRNPFWGLNRVPSHCSLWRQVKLNYVHQWKTQKSLLTIFPKQLEG